MILALFSLLTKNVQSVHTKNSNKVTLLICCYSEQKLLQKNAFAYHKWSVSHL